MKESEIIKALQGLSDKGKSAARSALGISQSMFAKIKEGGGAGPVKPLGGVTDSFSEYSESIKSQAAMMRSLGEANRFASEAGKELETQSFNLFGQIGQGREAVEALTENMRQFAFMNKDTQVQLGKSAMVLKQFGVGLETTAGILDNASQAFGMSQTELQGLATELATVAYKFPGQAQEIAQNFKKAQNSLAYDSGKIMTVFKGLQNISSTTGVSFNDLTSAFGESMDTFQGSSERAGKLNAVLGRSVFNSMDLLGKSEAERAKTVIEGVRQSIGGDVNKMGKFQLKAVADSMGVDVATARRLLSGKASPETVMKEKKDPKAALQEQANRAMDKNTMSLAELTTEFKTYRSVLDNMQIQGQAQIREGITSKAEGILQNTFDVEGAKIVSLSDAVDRLLVGVTTGNVKQAFEVREGIVSEQMLNLRRGERTGMVAEEAMVKEQLEKLSTVFSQFPEMMQQQLRSGINMIKTVMPNIEIPDVFKTSSSKSSSSGGDSGGSIFGNIGDTIAEKLGGLFSDGVTVNITGLQGKTLKGLMQTVPMGDSK